MWVKKFKLYVLCQLKRGTDLFPLTTLFFNKITALLFSFCAMRKRLTMNMQRAFKNCVSIPSTSHTDNQTHIKVNGNGITDFILNCRLILYLYSRHVGEHLGLVGLFRHIKANLGVDLGAACQPVDLF